MIGKLESTSIDKLKLVSPPTPRGEVIEDPHTIKVDEHEAMLNLL